MIIMLTFTSFPILIYFFAFYDREDHSVFAVRRSICQNGQSRLSRLCCSPKLRLPIRKGMLSCLVIALCSGAFHLVKLFTCALDKCHLISGWAAILLEKETCFEARVLTFYFLCFSSSYGLQPGRKQLSEWKELLMTLLLQVCWHFYWIDKWNYCDVLKNFVTEEEWIICNVLRLLGSLGCYFSIS